jgi:hypothetical protein
MAASKNKDSYTIKREGLLDAENMKIEFWDKDSETTHIFDLTEPFKKHHEDEVVITISFEIKPKAEKQVNNDGEVQE